MEEPRRTTCDVVLLSMGCLTHTHGLGLGNIGIAVDGKGFIPVKYPTYETACPRVYAIGDVISRPSVHKPEKALLLLNHIAGHAGHVIYSVISC